MAICNPLRRILRRRGSRAAWSRIGAFVIGFMGALCALTPPASAQALDLLQDTETERLLRSYEDPILTRGGASIPSPSKCTSSTTPR